MTLDVITPMSTTAKTILFLSVLAVVACVALVVYALFTHAGRQLEEWDRRQSKR
jgi:hypothetical protein